MKIVGGFLGGLALAASMAANAKPGAPAKGQHLEESKLAALPAYVTETLQNRRRDRYVYVTPQSFRPKIYDRLNGSRFESVSLGWLKIDPRANAESLRCAYVFFSGSANCLSRTELSKIASNTNSHGDLLQWARRESPRYGLSQTRDMLAILMKRRDANDGKLEANLLRANANKSWRASDSVLNAKLSRKRVGIFFFLGIDVSDHSPNRDQIREASRHAENLGFYSHTFETKPSAHSLTNAALIDSQIAAELAKVDTAVFVGASKGVADFLHYTFLHSHKLPASERAKLKIYISLSGAIRESFVADWVINIKRRSATTYREILKLFKKSAMPGVESLANSPWTYAKSPTALSQRFPNLKWVSFAMLPESADGMTYLDRFNVMFQERVYAEGRLRSPSDGLLESAASLLPPGTGVPEHVIRGYGPHALSLGYFLDSQKIAPLSQTGRRTPAPKAGQEIMDAFLRAMPGSWLN